jgi:hypothetical protein
MTTDLRACRHCACTDDYACLTPDGPCAWVAWDLCSACAGREELLERFLTRVVDPLFSLLALVLVAGLIVWFGGQWLLSLL